MQDFCSPNLYTIFNFVTRSFITYRIQIRARLSSDYALPCITPLERRRMVYIVYDNYHKMCIEKSYNKFNIQIPCLSNYGCIRYSIGQLLCDRVIEGGAYATKFRELGQVLRAIQCELVECATCEMFTRRLYDVASPDRAIVSLKTPTHNTQQDACGPHSRRVRLLLRIGMWLAIE